jgi:hypothetical protein
LRYQAAVRTGIVVVPSRWAAINVTIDDRANKAGVGRAVA